MGHVVEEWPRSLQILQRPQYGPGPGQCSVSTPTLPQEWQVGSLGLYVARMSVHAGRIILATWWSLRRNEWEMEIRSAPLTVSWNRRRLQT